MENKNKGNRKIYCLVKSQALSLLLFSIGFMILLGSLYWIFASVNLITVRIVATFFVTVIYLSYHLTVVTDKLSEKLQIVLDYSVHVIGIPALVVTAGFLSVFGTLIEAVSYVKGNNLVMLTFICGYLYFVYILGYTAISLLGIKKMKKDLYELGGFLQESLEEYTKKNASSTTSIGTKKKASSTTSIDKTTCSYFTLVSVRPYDSTSFKEPKFTATEKGIRLFCGDLVERVEFRLKSGVDLIFTDGLVQFGEEVVISYGIWSDSVHLVDFDKNREKVLEDLYSVFKQFVIE